MKYRVFSTGVFQFPFHTKRLAGLICFCFCLFCSPVLADEDTWQASTEDTRQLIKQAGKLARKGETAEAEKILRRVIKINPHESTAKLDLAYILLKQQKLSEAYNLSFEVAKAEPENSYAFAVGGFVLLSYGNFSDAKTLFVNALLLDKKEALAWAGLGTLDFYENRIFDSIAKLREAVYYESKEPDYIFTLAQVLARAERYKEAAAAYEHFLLVSPQADAERRDRIKGLINFLRFLGIKQSLYDLDGAEQTLVQFRLLNNRPVIQVKINKKDEPLNFVLDTGSGISVVSQETAKRLKIKPVTKGGLARAIGGDGKFQIVYGFLKRVEIGDVQIKNVPVYIREFHSTDERVDGYIGLALISKFLTTIDYGDSTFALKKKDSDKERQIADNQLWLPLRLTSSGFLSGEVQLEGVEAPLNFIVDTGASVSVISDDVASTKEISRFIKEETMRVSGAAGITDNVPLFLLPRVSFGSHSRESIMAIALNLDLINEASGFQQAGILGGNFLKNYRLTFDFVNSKVVFEPLVK